jgi:hypothetical protein
VIDASQYLADMPLTPEVAEKRLRLAAESLVNC